MPFAPVHLLFINLLTDSLPAIALGLEPDRSEVMSEKPRLADESILTKDFLSKIGLEGLVIGAMTMISFLTGYNQNGTLLGSTYAFGTLCLARLFHGYNCKSDHPVIFTKGLFHNKWLQGAFVLGAVLITTVLTVPGFHNLFKVETLNVVGGSVGLPSIWVLAAVTIGGNLMGIIGMLIFIPLVSVFYTIFREFVYLRLKKQHIKRVTRTDVEEYAEEEIASSFIVPNEK